MNPVSAERGCAHRRIYHWALGRCPSLLELRKISHMAKNATLEELPQSKIAIIVAPNSISAGDPPPPPAGTTGKVTTLPRTSVWI